jgi:iron complex outermembrane recepter protein
MNRTLLLALCLCASAALAEIVAPKVVESPAAIYPSGSTGSATVVTLATVDAAGRVTAAEVAESGGAAFDAAALEAVRRWTFQPALRDGEPVPARIRIPFRFEPPPPPALAPDAGPPADAGVAEAKPVVLPVAPAGPETAAPEEGPIEEVTVRGTRRVNLGSSDFQIELGQLAANVGASAAKALELAPGIVIGNEGGLGHAQQIILRGFNADQGSAVEFTFQGIPINQVANTDAQGYADLNFLIPELVREVRVLEGPYDPHQGDFAGAGSADFVLGVTERGVRVGGWWGSFGTTRLVGVLAPAEERVGTFLGFQYLTTDGYGSNRSGTAVSAIGQYEGTLGSRGLWHLLATGYATHYASAGVVREDDVEAGRIGYYGTYDTLLGGDAQTFNLAGDIESPLGAGVLKLQVFLVWRTLRILENFVGYFLDTPPGIQGAGIQQSYSAFTTGSRGSYRLAGQWLGQEQSVEFGYYARYDHATPLVERLLAGTTTPYALENDVTADVVNLAGYVDADFRPTSWLRFHGGFRHEYFSYDVLFNCQDQGGSYVAGTPLATVCAGSGGAPERRSTGAGLFEPRVTALVQVTPTIALSASYGVGAQSLDAQDISLGGAPFSEQKAVEGGVLYHRRFPALDVSARAVGFYSTLTSDYRFDPELGTAVLTAGTTRVGFVSSARATGTFYDLLGSLTYANATANDTGLLVPLVPAWVVRIQGALFGPLPLPLLFGAPLTGKLVGEASFVGSRPVAAGVRSPSTFVLNLEASLRWRMVELGVRAENLTNLQYALTPFYDVANFHPPQQPLVAYNFTAAPPRAFYLTFALIFGGP